MPARRAAAVLLLSASLTSAWPGAAWGASPTLNALESEVVRLRAELDAQAEARDRQADGFDAAVTQIETVNVALAIVLALGGILASILSFRWVKGYTERQIDARIDSSIERMGRKAFEAKASALKAEYDDRFTELYARIDETFEQRREH